MLPPDEQDVEPSTGTSKPTTPDPDTTTSARETSADSEGAQVALPASKQVVASVHGDPTLMGIPGELRNQIYRELLIIDDKHTCSPNILAVSRHINAGGNSILCEENTLTIIFGATSCKQYLCPNLIVRVGNRSFVSSHKHNLLQDLSSWPGNLDQIRRVSLRIDQRTNTYIPIVPWQHAIWQQLCILVYLLRNTASLQIEATVRSCGTWLYPLTKLPAGSKLTVTDSEDDCTARLDALRPIRDSAAEMLFLMLDLNAKIDAFVRLQQLAGMQIVGEKFFSYGLKRLQTHVDAVTYDRSDPIRRPQERDGNIAVFCGFETGLRKFFESANIAHIRAEAERKIAAQGAERG